MGANSYFRAWWASTGVGCAVALLGCGQGGGIESVSDADSEDVGSVSSALVGQVHIDTPSVQPLAEPGESQFSIAHSVVWRRAGGASPNNIVTYGRSVGLDDKVVNWNGAAASPALTTQTRPIRFWDTDFMTFYAPVGVLGALTDSRRNIKLFPTTFSAGHLQNGPPWATQLNSSQNADLGVFARMTDGKIYQSYIPDGVAWADFPLQHPHPTATSSPVAFRRSADTDSVFFACGTGTTLCEIRLLPNGSSTWFSTTFGTGDFATDTQPTAISSKITANSPDNGRWIFAVVTKGGKHYTYARRDKSAGSASTAPDYSESYTFSSGNVGTTFYGTVMPYINKDGKIATVQFARGAGENSIVRERVWNQATSTWTLTQIHDVGKVIPENSEPVPSVVYPQSPQTHVLGNGRSSIVFRLPDASDSNKLKDTVELRQQANGSYVKTTLPAAEDNSNLFIFHGSKLYRSDESSGARWEPGSTWSSVTSFASDRIGLGYAIVNSKLYEINLQDSTSRQLGTASWSGATELTYGFDYPSGDPKLWAIQGGTLYKVDLSNGSRQALNGCPTGWSTNTTSMAYLNIVGLGWLDWSLYVISNGALYSVNSNTGGCAQLSGAADWPGETSMSADPKDKKLYVVGGPGNKLRRVSHQGVVEAWSQTNRWTGATSIAYMQGNAYVVKGATLYRVPPSNLDSLSNPVGTSDWTGQTYMAPRAWQMSWSGCDLGPTNTCY